MCKITDLPDPYLYKLKKIKLLLIYHVAKHIYHTQMCSNTIPKPSKLVIMNINNQYTFLELYYASNVIVDK